MKILHIITDLEVGGAETALCRLAEGLDPARFEQRVVSLMPPGPLAERLARASIPVDHLDMRRSRPSISAVSKLVRLIRAWRPDLVQTWLYHADLLGLICAKLSMVRPKVVWNLRCARMDLEHYSPMTARVLRVCTMLSARPDAIVANSRAAVDHHRALGYRPNRYEVVPNGFDTGLFRPDPRARARFRAELGVADQIPLLGLAARFDPMKDVPGFLDALALAAGERDLRAALMGPGLGPDNPELAALIRERGLKRICLPLGVRRDLHTLLPGLDLMVSSSRGESFPNVLGEAMACGVVCVATDVGDTKLLLGDTGAVVLPENPGELSRAVLETLNRKDFKELQTKARERIRDGFSLDRTIHLYTDIYQSLIG